jgi:hypothetical protein
LEWSPATAHDVTITSQGLYCDFPHPKDRIRRLALLMDLARHPDVTEALSAGELGEVRRLLGTEMSRAQRSLVAERELARRARETYRATNGGDGASIDDYCRDLRPITIRPRAQARRRRETGGRRSGSNSRGSPGLDSSDEPEPGRPRYGRVSRALAAFLRRAGS